MLVNYAMPEPLAIYSEEFYGRETRVSNDELSAKFAIGFIINTIADDQRGYSKLVVSSANYSTAQLSSQLGQFV